MTHLNVLVSITQTNTVFIIYWTVNTNKCSPITHVHSVQAGDNVRASLSPLQCRGEDGVDTCTERQTSPSNHLRSAG